MKEKLERLKAVLQEKAIAYKEDVFDERSGVQMAISVPKLSIAVFCGDSQETYMKVRGKYAPLFIRESETMEHTVEKMENLIASRKNAEKIARLRKEASEERRKYAEECERRHREKLRIKAANDDGTSMENSAKLKRKRIIHAEKV